MPKPAELSSRLLLTNAVQKLSAPSRWLLLPKSEETFWGPLGTTVSSESPDSSLGFSEDCAWTSAGGYMWRGRRLLTCST